MQDVTETLKSTPTIVIDIRYYINRWKYQYQIFRMLHGSVTYQDSVSHEAKKEQAVHDKRVSYLHAAPL